MVLVTHIYCSKKSFRFLQGECGQPRCRQKTINPSLRLAFFLIWSHCGYQILRVSDLGQRVSTWHFATWQAIEFAQTSDLMVSHLRAINHQAYTVNAKEWQQVQTLTNLIADDRSWRSASEKMWYLKSVQGYWWIDWWHLDLLIDTWMNGW